MKTEILSLVLLVIIASMVESKQEIKRKASSSNVSKTIGHLKNKHDCDRIGKLSSSSSSYPVSWPQKPSSSFLPIFKVLKRRFYKNPNSATLEKPSSKSHDSSKKPASSTLHSEKILSRKPRNSSEHQKGKTPKHNKLNKHVRKTKTKSREQPSQKPEKKLTKSILKHVSRIEKLLKKLKKSSKTM